MTTGDPQNFHVMVSTGSGTGQGFNVWEQLLKPFLDSVGGNSMGERYQLHFTASESSISDFTRTVLLPQANAGVVQSLVLLSGDGGLVDVANNLLSEPRSQQYQKPSIAILPLGTGNALAHSSGITKDKTLGLSALVRGSPEEIPLFGATFSLQVHAYSPTRLAKNSSFQLTTTSPLATAQSSAPGACTPV
jgi:diacylglycerol kinase family enzyme